MTKHHSHGTTQHEFAKSRAGTADDLSLSRRDFLRTGMVVVGGALLPRFLENLRLEGLEQELKEKRIYIAADDHTDLFWTADLETYERAFVEMLDYYLDLADKTQNEPVEFQSRWNCDGSFWVWMYERKKPQADFERLIERIRDGHISMPLNALCVCLGGASAEAVLRGMYYPGRLERRHNLHFKLAYSLENQTLPFGLGSLWSGSGATFSWKGICGCATQIPDAWDREHDIYWWVGADGSRILMKWNSMLHQDPQYPGGYAEARYPEVAVHYLDTDEKFKARYPYHVVGAFGYGWDDLQSQTENFVVTAKNMSTQQFKVIVSNELDFAQDFEQIYGNSIPSVSASFGNEWDLDCATMSEVSARYKRAVEKLRVAESLATLISLKMPDFMQGREVTRDQAWMNMGLFWEHDWQGAPWGDLTQKRIEWTRKIVGEIELYVDSLMSSATSTFGGMIQASGENERFFVFNPLSWVRTEYADYEFSAIEPVHVVDLKNNQEVPSQMVIKDGKRWLRIQAPDIPPVGYKVFEIRTGVGQSFSDAGSIAEGQLENQYLRLTVDGRGAITSLEDKLRKRQLVAEINDRALNDLGPGTGNLQIENVGPVSVTVLASSDAPLHHTARITLFRDSDRVEIQNDITQNFDATQTWAFSFSMNNPSVHHEEVGAILHARLTTEGGQYSPRNARYDWLTLNHFVDISQDDTFGITLSNPDCYFMKLGNSTTNNLDTQTPQISILAGGRDMNGPGILTNQGGDEHFLQRFALKAHDTYNPVSAMKFALEHQNPLLAGKVLGGNSYPDVSFSLITIDDPGVLLWALKPAEDGMQAGVVARVWNVSNEPSRFFLRWNEGGINSAFTLTHIETPVGLANVEHGILMEFITPQQIRTYSLFTPQMPDLPASAGFASSTIVPQLQGTATGQMDRSATPVLDAAGPSASEGRGCLLGLLGNLV